MVGIVRCKEYNEEEVERALKEALSYIRGLEIIRPGDKVFLKPNMLMAARPEDSVTTHPLILKILIRMVKERGGIPFIGDSPGNAYANVHRAMEMTGFKKVAEEEGAEIVSFEKDIVKYKGIYVARAVLDARILITLPKLKTHNFTLFTGAIKNSFGIVPGFHKGEYHCLFPHPQDFARKLVEIFSLKKPALAIMDAVYAMEGHGPSGGKGRYLGLILASKDCVALDAVAARIIGYHPWEIDTTRIAEASGLGTADLKKIEIKGLPLKKVIVADFKLANNANVILRRIPRFIYPPFQWLARKLIRIHPAVDKEKCNGCLACLKNCPVKCIKMKDSFPRIDYKKCISCYCCMELCPQKAMQVERSWLARKWQIGVQG